MRLGVFSDVHGNLFALRAVLAELDRTGVDDLVCAGDLVGYGPHPDGCVELLAERGVRCVAGNHDLMVAGLLPDARRSPLAERSRGWTASVLSEASLGLLAGLPAEREIGGLVVTHGALGDPQRYTATPEHAAAQLDRLARDRPGATGLVLGHTHRQWVHREHEGPARPSRSGRTRVRLGGGRWMLNPGSVGQSRQWERRPMARFAVLDLAAGTADLHAVRYDDAACADALARIGMPRAALHVRPGAAAVWRRARRAVRAR